VWVCASCGQENPDGFKFCGNCGAPLAAPAPAREVRKVVTIVFCDLTGSTALGDRTDPETLRATMRGYYEEMRIILERHGGTVEKFVGDAVMAVFGVPVSREDDALRAVRAAWEMRAAVGELGLQARIGVNTGEVVAGEGDTLVTGDAVNVAARLEQAAEAGEVLIGAETHRHVRDAATVEQVQVTAKGKPEPIPALRILELDLEASGVARRLDTPLVGRERELALLRQTYDTAAREQSCHLFTLLGPAGVGKSRLVAELLTGLDANVVRGRCLDYGDGITFWPVIEVLKQLGAESAVEAIATGSVSSNELFLTVRRALEDAAQGGPLVVVFEDIHWGEPTFLDLLDHVSDLSRGVPILLLCVARPELLDDRPGWGGGKLNATSALLQPLTSAESNALLDGLNAGEVDEDTRARIVETAAGNPLFVEEMLALAREGGDIHAPSTIQALLQARLDRLGSAERSVIERGAVQGELFHRGAVHELGNGGGGEGLDAHLVGLVRKELIRPERGPLPDDDAYRFRHLLIRDVTYDGLPKETRADLHLRFARWVSAHARIVELDEIVGYHLEQAALYRRELGRPDAEIDAQAAERLTAAGESAVAREDLPAAENLLGRALALLPPGNPVRDRALHALISTLMWSSPFEHVDALITELESSVDPVMRMNGRVARAQHRLHFDPGYGVAEMRQVAEEARQLFTEIGDHSGLSHVYLVLANASWFESQARATLDYVVQAREHALRGENLNVRSFALAIGPLTHGPLLPDEVRARLDELFGGHESRFLTQGRLMTEAMLERLEGNFEGCLEHWAEGDAILGELGLVFLRHVMHQVPAESAYAQGRYEEAVRLYRETYDGLGTMGETGFRSTVSIELGESLYALGEDTEAEQLAIEGEAMSSADDLVNFALGRGLRARILADRGELEAGEALALDAIEYARRSDFPQIHARTDEALAHVRRAQGRIEESRSLLEQAARAHESRGDVVFAGRMRELLVEL
jgi:class 3 adenylate cyclase/tetratricopeptide (TPR) repeat protein